MDFEYLDYQAALDTMHQHTVDCRHNCEAKKVITIIESEPVEEPIIKEPIVIKKTTIKNVEK